jgi:hypothetical protein
MTFEIGASRAVFEGTRRRVSLPAAALPRRIFCARERAVGKPRRVFLQPTPREATLLVGFNVIPTHYHALRV